VNPVSSLRHVRGSVYAFAGCPVESAFSLPELPAGSLNGVPPIRFRMGRGPAPRPGSASRVCQRLCADDAVWMNGWRTPRGYLLDFPDFARFAVAQRAAGIACWAGPKGSPATLRHLLIDQVLPLALGLRRILLLHASGVAVGSRSIALLGESGRGKSTLALALARHGCRLLSDDCLRLDDPVLPRATGSYAALRLWPDVAEPAFGAGLPPAADYTEKRKISGAALPFEFSPEPVPLGRLYLLGEDAPSVCFEPVTSADAIIELVRSHYLIDPEDANLLRWQFEQLGRLASQPIFRRLHYPREVEALPHVCDAIFEDLNGH
jgi:hypothetical protein